MGVRSIAPAPGALRLAAGAKRARLSHGLGFAPRPSLATGPASQDALRTR
jgi:hypothetical protein